MNEKWPWKKIWRWHDRTKMIAQLIPAGCSVIDLGAGMCYLKRFVKGKYTAIDRQKWRDEIVTADFNKGEYPDIDSHDVIVCQGVIEYIGWPQEFLCKIHKYGNKMIISYYYGKNNVESRRNFLDSPTFENMLIEHDWFITGHIDLENNEKIYSCINWKKQ